MLREQTLGSEAFGMRGAAPCERGKEVVEIEGCRPYFSDEDSLASNKGGEFLP
jgi:hypothetical protein